MLYLYAKANTKSKKKRLLYDLGTLSELFSMYPNVNETFPWESDTCLMDLVEDESVPFIDYIIRNKTFFNRSFLDVINTFKLVEFPFYADYGKDCRRLPQNITTEVMLFF